MEQRKFLNISELNAEYKSGLTEIPGDREFRYKVLSPLFEKLYENKVVYYERFVCIAKLENIKITPERIHAIAVPQLLIKKGYGVNKIPDKWDFSAPWEVITLAKNAMTFYSGLSIWCDPVTVEKVEKLALERKFEEALNLTLREDWYNVSKQ